jgi:hypothetical protein
MASTFSGSSGGERRPPVTRPFSGSSGGERAPVLRPASTTRRQTVAPFAAVDPEVHPDANPAASPPTGSMEAPDTEEADASVDAVADPAQWLASVPHAVEPTPEDEAIMSTEAASDPAASVLRVEDLFGSVVDLSPPDAAGDPRSDAADIIRGLGAPPPDVGSIPFFSDGAGEPGMPEDASARDESAAYLESGNDWPFAEPEPLEQDPAVEATFGFPDPPLAADPADPGQLAFEADAGIESEAVTGLPVWDAPANAPDESWPPAAQEVAAAAEGDTAFAAPGVADVRGGVEPTVVGDEAWGPERAAEMLETVARMVRSREIVVSVMPGATAESVLASILASLLSPPS